MQKLLVFSLSVLVVIAFLGGINLGKKIQSIDTPVKTVIKKVVITVIPSTIPTGKTASPSGKLILK